MEDRPSAGLAKERGSFRERPSQITTTASFETEKHANVPSTPSPRTKPGRFSMEGKQHSRFLVADPVAYKYLEEDESTTVLDRHRDLHGYQAYVVEQWACTRAHPTFVIASYTGDPTHKITVNVLGVPADEELWSPRLRIYFKELSQYNGKRHDTDLGSLIVTSLSSFPSSLTLIPVINGDVRSCREDFFVNEDLKRLGCSGRVGMTLSKPNASTEAKFHQLFRTSEKNPLYASVMELVKLIQLSLILFGKLGSEFGDGLLCDVTEKALEDWWIDIGSDLYNTEPNDGTCGPMTVAALVGTLIGARNRLNAFGAPVEKDVFDVEATKRAIAYFQKAQKIPKTRRLDRTTIRRLHKATEKQASGEGWAVPRAVKSTVAELSGKGGEMVMDMVSGGREKALIAEVETTDINRFAELVKGQRARWLWQGKPHKRLTRDLFGEETSRILHHQEPHNSLRQGDRFYKSLEGRFRRPEAPSRNSTDGDRTNLERQDPDTLRKKTMLNRAKGRFKGAVGRTTNHIHRTSDAGLSALNGGGSRNSSSDSIISFEDQDYSDFNKRGSDVSDRESHEHGRLDTRFSIFASEMTDTPIDARQDIGALPDIREGHVMDSSLNPADVDYQISKVISNQRQVAEKVARSTTIDGGFPEDQRPAQNVGLLLRASRSFSRFETMAWEAHTTVGWPRTLSFSAAEDALHASEKLSADDEEWDEATDVEGDNPRQDLVRELIVANHARRLREMLACLGRNVAYPTQEALNAIKQLAILAEEDIEQLNELFYLRANEVGKTERDQRDIIEEQRANLLADLKEAETMQAKLDYEMDTLRSKVEDVEDAVAEFENQVVYTEGRVDDLTRDKSHEKTQSVFTRLFAAMYGSTVNTKKLPIKPLAKGLVGKSLEDMQNQSQSASSSLVT